MMPWRPFRPDAPPVTTPLKNPPAPEPPAPQAQPDSPLVEVDAPGAHKGLGLPPPPK